MAFEYKRNRNKVASETTSPKFTYTRDLEKRKQIKEQQSALSSQNDTQKSVVPTLGALLKSRGTEQQNDTKKSALPAVDALLKSRGNEQLKNRAVTNQILKSIEESNKALEERERLLNLNVEEALAKADFYADIYKQINYRQNEIDQITREMAGSTSEKFRANSQAIIDEDKRYLDYYNKELRSIAEQYGWSDVNETVLRQEAAKIREEARKAEYLQQGKKLRDEALSAPDFETNNKYGTELKGPEWLGEKDYIKSWFLDEGYSGAPMSGYDIDFYNAMNEEEKKILGYYLATVDGSSNGENDAIKYLKSIKEEVEARRIQGIVDSLDTDFKKWMFSHQVGLDQFGRGLEGFGNIITGEDGYVPQTATQMASQKIKEDIKNSEGFKNKALGFAYDIGVTSTNMLPSILVGLASPAAGAALMGTTAGGNAYNEMINEGRTWNEAVAYGSLVGISETMLERTLGGVVGKEKLVGVLMPKLKKAAARVSVQMGESIISEFTEESLQTVLEPFFETLVTGVDYNAPDIEEILYSGLLGAVSGGMFSGGKAGGTSIINTVMERAQIADLGETILDTDNASENIKSLIDNAQQSDNKKLQKAANKVAKTEQNGTYDVSARKVGRLAQLSQEQLARTLDETATGRDMKSQAVAKMTENGMKPKEAGKVFDLILRDAPHNKPSMALESIMEKNSSVRPIYEQMVEYLSKEAIIKRYEDTQKASPITKISESIIDQRLKDADIDVVDDVVDESGEIDNIDSVVNVDENGNYILKRESGETFVYDKLSDNLPNVDENTANKVAYAVNFSANGANAYVKLAPNNATPQYKAEFTTIYNQGATNKAFTQIESDIPSEVQKAIYEAGKADFEVAKQRRQKAETEAKEREASFVKKEMGFKSDRVTVSEAALAKLKAAKKDGKGEQYKAAVEVIDGLAKMLQVNINIVASETDANGKYIGANGMYNRATNTFTFDITSGMDNVADISYTAMIKTAGHELTHFIQNWSPSKYLTLKNTTLKFLTEEHSEQWINEQLKAIQQNNKAIGKNLTLEQAKDELVADAFEDVLGNIDFAETVLRTDKTLFDKIHSWVKKNANDFKKNLGIALKDVKAQTEAGLTMKEAGERAQALYNEWSNAFSTALENSTSFNMGQAIEQNKDLVAFHNITAEQLRDAVERNNLLMPSIAISNKAISEFGEISIVFDKSTIDPKLADNKLFGSDAWTPTRSELKKNAKFDRSATEAFVKRAQDAIGSRFDYTAQQLEDAIFNADGSIYNAFASDPDMQAIYAAENGIAESEIEATLDSDNGWRQYKKWLNGISDELITSYDSASNEEIISDMKSQPATAKPFKLSENGELVVPVAEYSSIEDLRKNKNRLSENADEQLKTVGEELLSWAKDISLNSDATLRKTVSAINNTFDSRYSIPDIVRSFKRDGIDISRQTASELQSLYKKAVELPTRYFEAKPQRAVSLSEIKAIVMPENGNMSDLEAHFNDMGIEIVKYTTEQSRIDALNSLDNVKFQARGVNNTPTIEVTANDELNALINNSNKSKYSVIRDYLVRKFFGKKFVLSDGIEAIMDKSDAKELSHKADTKKTVALGNLREIVESAVLTASAEKISHKKFDAFRYYAVNIVYENEMYPLLINVGRSKYTKEHHIYDITKNKRTANQSSTGLSRPVGNAIKSDSSKNRIPQESSSVKENISDTQNQARKKPTKAQLDDLKQNGITMNYVRIPNQNTPYYGSSFGQNIEPAGEYMSMDTMQGKNKIESYEYGTIQFKKPLVLEHINTTDTGWKKTVSDMYNGLTGKKLTKALIKDGYDAIITYDDYGYNEIVNLNGNKLNKSDPYTQNQARVGKEQDGNIMNSARTNAALETFGTTTDVEKAGFAIPDGRMLNLSKYGLRGTNHKLIEAVFEDVKGNAAVNAFIQEGNVRLKASAPGVEIGETIAPTTAQLNAVSRLIRNTLYERGRFYLDITAEDGSSIASVEYGDRDSIQDILYDIKAYYDRGKIPVTQKASAYSYYSARNTNKNYLDVESRFDVAESVLKYADTVSDPALKAKLKANATAYAKQLDTYETESIRYDNAVANGWEEMAAAAYYGMTMSKTVIDQIETDPDFALSLESAVGAFENYSEETRQKFQRKFEQKFKSAIADSKDKVAYIRNEMRAMQRDISEAERTARELAQREKRARYRAKQIELRNQRDKYTSILAKEKTRIKNALEKPTENASVPKDTKDIAKKVLDVINAFNVFNNSSVLTKSSAELMEMMISVGNADMEVRKNKTLLARTNASDRVLNNLRYSFTQVKATLDSLVAEYEKLSPDYERSDGEKAPSAAASIVYNETLHNALKELSEDFGKPKSVFAHGLGYVYEGIKVIRAMNHQLLKANQMYVKGKSVEVLKLRNRLYNDIDTASPFLNKFLGNALASEVLMPKTMLHIAFGATDNADVFYNMLDDGQMRYIRFINGAKDIFAPVEKEIENEKFKSDTPTLKTGLKYQDGTDVLLNYEFALSFIKIVENPDSLRHAVWGGLQIPDLKPYNKGDKKTSYNSQRIVEHAQPESAPKVMTDEDIAKKLQDAASKGVELTNEEYLDMYAEQIAWNNRLNLAAEIEAKYKAAASMLKEQMSKTDTGRQALKMLSLMTKYYDEYARKYLNEATMELYGFEKTLQEGKTYYPIRVMKNEKASDDNVDIVRDYSLENWGAMKHRVESKKGIELYGALTELESYMENTAKYYAWTNVTKNMKKILNTQIIDNDGTVTTLVSKINKLYGSYDPEAKGLKRVKNKFMSGFETYMKDLQSEIVGANKGGEKWTKLQGAFVTNALLLNVSTPMVQFSATNLVAVDSGYLSFIKTVGKSGKIPGLLSEAQKKYVAKYSEVYKYRSGGLIDIDLAAAKANKNVLSKALSSKALAWTESADSQVLGKQFYALLDHVKRTHKGISAEEAAQIAGKQLDQTIYEFQANYTVLQRAPLLRGSGIKKLMLGTFRTQQITMLNAMIDSSVKTHTLSEQMKRVDKDSSEYKSIQRKHKDALTRSYKVYVAVALSNLCNAAIRMGVGVLRRKDDEEKIETAWLDFLDSYMTMVPLFGDIASYLIRRHYGETYFGDKVFSIGMLDMLSDAVESLSDIENMIVGGEDQELSRYINELNKVCAPFGVPARNVYNIIKMVLGWSEEAADAAGLSWDLDVDEW